VKRREFVRQLIREGCVLLRPGTRHDLYVNPRTGQRQTVPRHTELDNDLARHIRKRLGLK
jgi:predicted RNA binding protein YcfA (HicA-like mRNA interferase family)